MISDNKTLFTNIITNTYHLVISLSTVMCSLQPDTGPCKASFLSYYWNINTRQCERFIYGGCGGSYNRFLDAISCASTCGKYVAKCFGTFISLIVLEN